MSKWYGNLTKLAMPIEYKSTGLGYGKSYYLNLTGPEFDAFKNWLLTSPAGKSFWSFEDRRPGDEDYEDELKDNLRNKRAIERATSIKQLENGVLAEVIDEALSKFFKENKNRFHFK